jgi:hypothetical protein
MTVQDKPADPIVPKNELWQLVMDLGHVPLDEAIQVGDVYVTAYGGKSYVLTCKVATNDMIIPESAQYAMYANECVKIERPDHAKK